MQLTFLEPLLSWLEARDTEPGGFAEGLLDLEVLGVVGHSRGGKLATLHFAGDTDGVMRLQRKCLLYHACINGPWGYIVREAIG